MLERFPPKSREASRKNSGQSWMDCRSAKMLSAQATSIPTVSLGRQFRRVAIRTALLAVCTTLSAISSALAADAGGSGGVTTAAGDGGFSIIDWAIVVVMIGAALFAVCRTSRRN